MRRASGVLLHITSLPSPHGIGDFGPCAYRWVDFLAAGKQQYWQVLPLGPTGFGNSPYSSFSAFAGNPLLTSLEGLIEDNLLKPEQVDRYDGPPGRVLFDQVKTYKLVHLNRAYENFKAGSDLTAAFQQFCQENVWLENFVEYIYRKDQSDKQYIRFQQFVFFRQLAKLKSYANQKGIQIIGDLPMYVAGDSADRYQAPELFDLDSGFSAGSPPSNAFPAGQKWGNPLYKWDKHRETGYRWWIDRIKAQLQQVDIIRLDYFCGYVAYWATTGSTGHWRRGPEADLFECTRRAMNGKLPFIAEDLGELTPELKNLLNRFSLPGMKVLHYAFDGEPQNPYLPHNFDHTNCVVYPGTHDNDTTKGWFQSAPDYVKQNACNYLKCDGRDISWDLIKLAARSKADLLIIPYQDVLCLGTEARFNTPGTVGPHNWSWMLRPEQVDDKIAGSLAWLANDSHRC